MQSVVCDVINEVTVKFGSSLVIKRPKISKSPEKFRGVIKPIVIKPLYQHIIYFERLKVI